MTEAPDQAPAKRAGWTIPFRTLAIALLILAVGMAAAVALRGHTDPDSRFTVVEGRQADSERERDPLAAELARCRTVPADTVDARCQAAWEAHRRYFYGDRRRTPSPNPEGQ